MLIGRPTFCGKFQKLLLRICWSSQRRGYVNVYMKWKQDRYFDSLEHIHSSLELKRIVSLKNFIVRSPNGCIPISDVSKRGLDFDVKIRVAAFLRQYPSIFEEFVGPKYHLPWFRLTQEAIRVDEEEKRVFRESEQELLLRLRKLILMSKENVVPLKIIKGLLWYLGLPEDLVDSTGEDVALKSDGLFKVIELEGGLKGLGVESKERVLSFFEENAIKRGELEAVEFPLFPSKGMRLRKRISQWLEGFQKLPYVSPYEDFSGLNPDSDVAEKRLVGFLHELFCLFIDHSAQRRKLLCLKKPFGLPQKMHKAFERHPHMFYLSFRKGTCTVILKEAYRDESSIEKHPMLEVRKKYVELMCESQRMMRKRRSNLSSVPAYLDKQGQSETLHIERNIQASRDET